MWLSNFFSCHHSFVTIHRRNRLCDNKATDICSLFYTYSCFFFCFLLFFFKFLVLDHSCKELLFIHKEFSGNTFFRAFLHSNVYGPGYSSIKCLWTLNQNIALNWGSNRDPSGITLLRGVIHAIIGIREGK